MGNKKNRNEKILSNEDLVSEINYSEFDYGEYGEYFDYLCNLIPNIEKERIEIESIDNEKIEEEGLVYIFTIEDKILKIGHTTTSIKKRIQSYNCGRKKHREKGTCSTTNYFILQSILNINKTVKVHAFFPEKPTFNLFGKHYQKSSSPAKEAEKQIIKDFMTKFNKKPIGCTQR